MGGGGISQPLIVHRTNINTKPFFRDLSKPLLVKNEYNTYNIEYIIDNVRKSEDYGGDNHVYLYYENFNDFILFLQAEDISKYLAEEKIVFLFEEKISDYPIDFKKEYGINYANLTPKAVRIDEIKRIFVHWAGYGPVGCQLWSGITDFHKNLLTIKNFGLSGISYIYEKLLKGKTVNELSEALSENEDHSIYWEFNALFSDKTRYSFHANAPKVKCFFDELKKFFSKDYKPSKFEWYVGMFLAYQISLGRDLNQRIAPAVVFHSHHVYWNLTIDMKDNFELFEKFKYLRIISFIRRPTACMASTAAHSIKTDGIYDFWGMLALSFSPPLNGETNDAPTCFSPNFKYLPYMAAVRFEDIKTEPKATLEALLDFLDFEWEDSLLKTTANGTQDNTIGNTGKAIKDFDPTPVFRSKEKFFSPFDLYRIELIFSDLYRNFGYMPEYANDKQKYTKNEIIELFKKPFEYENFLDSDEEIKNFKTFQTKLINAIAKILNRPPGVTKNGEKIVPLPWLKPKEEFMKGKLYE